MVTTKRIGLVGALAALALALALAGCTGATTNPPSAADLATFQISGDEVEPYVGFDDMRKSADLSVLGVLGDPQGIRTVGEPGSEAYLLQFAVKADTVLAGRAPDEVVVEITLGATSREQADQALKQYAELLQGHEVLLYLRAKQGPGESGLYRPVNSLGFWMATAEAPASAPLADFDPATLAQFSKDLATEHTLVDIVDGHSD